MKRYISIPLFVVMLLISSCKRKCSFCEQTFPNGGTASRDVCRKDFDSKAEWEAEIKVHEELGDVCIEHR